MTHFISKLMFSCKCKYLKPDILLQHKYNKKPPQRDGFFIFLSKDYFTAATFLACFAAFLAAFISDLVSTFGAAATSGALASTLPLI